MLFFSCNKVNNLCPYDDKLFTLYFYPYYRIDGMTKPNTRVCRKKCVI